MEVALNITCPVLSQKEAIWAVFGNFLLQILYGTGVEKQEIIDMCNKCRIGCLLQFLR